MFSPFRRKQMFAQYSSCPSVCRLLCSCAHGMTFCSTLMGCATHHATMYEYDLKTSVVQIWHVDGVWLKHSSLHLASWRSANCALTLSRKCLIDTLKTVRTRPSRSTSAVVNSLPSSPAQALHSDLRTNYKPIWTESNYKSN